MDKKEYDEMLPSIPREQQSYFQNWYIAHQDAVTWQQFKSKGYQHVVKVKKEVEKHVQKVTGKPKQLKLAFMPTEMARTSPFFPMRRKDMQDRPLYVDFVIENTWGRITFSGPRLSISDESVLLALCFLAKKHKSEHFQTSYPELCKIMGISRGKNPYTAIRKTLDRLTMSVVKTELFEQENAVKEVSRSISGAIISNVDQQLKSSKVTITLSSYFLSLYAANLTTSLDMEQRSKIKGDTAKALYRFLQTHDPSKIPFGLLTLCHGINVNAEQPLADIRKQIRTALKELRKNKHINNWKIDKADNVHISR